jgi:hypothetical protein
MFKVVIPVNLSIHRRLHFFTNRKDITKTENIIAALTRKVAAPAKLYKTPPAINPIILATPPKLPAMPWTAP